MAKEEMKSLLFNSVDPWSKSIRSKDLTRCTKNTYLHRLYKILETGIVEKCIETAEPRKCLLDSIIDEIYKFDGWTENTKRCSISIFRLFYIFATTREREECINSMDQHAVKYILSNVYDQELSRDLNVHELLELMRVQNKRDAEIIERMIDTGGSLEEVIDKNGFVSYKGNRLCRYQVCRNLKKVSKKLGLNFTVTPKLLHRYVNAYMERKKSYEQSGVQEKEELLRSIVRLMEIPPSSQALADGWKGT